MKPSLARVVAALREDVAHPIRYQSSLINQRRNRGNASGEEVYLGIGYWLRYIGRRRMFVTMRCEMWDMDLNRYVFVTWRDVLVEGATAETCVLEYPARSKRYWRLMRNDEKGFPYRDAKGPQLRSVDGEAYREAILTQRTSDAVELVVPYGRVRVLATPAQVMDAPLNAVDRSRRHGRSGRRMTTTESPNAAA